MIPRKRPNSLRPRPAAQPELPTRPDPETFQAAPSGQPDETLWPPADPAPVQHQPPNEAAAPESRPTGHSDQSVDEQIAQCLQSSDEKEFVARVTDRFCMPLIGLEEDISALMEDSRLSAGFRSALAAQLGYYKGRLEELEIELIEGIDVGIAADGSLDGESVEPSGGSRRKPKMSAPGGDASQPREMTMTGSRSTGSTGHPRRPHDRLAKLYGRAYAALEAMDAEINFLIERGEMDGDPKEGMDASEWAGRLADLQGMAEGLALRIDECDDGEA